jgi:hypothetical protein
MQWLLFPGSKEAGSDPAGAEATLVIQAHSKQGDGFIHVLPKCKREQKLQERFTEFLIIIRLDSHIKWIALHALLRCRPWRRK